MKRKHSNIAAALEATAWAILPQKWDEISALLDELGPDVLSKTTDFDEYSQTPITVANGIATVPFEGTMMRKANLFSKVSGGVSADLTASALRDLAADPAVKAILMHANSPGGAVDGVEALGRVVSEVAQQKPVYVFADSLLASAAYWALSGATKIYAAPDAIVGSIGVIHSRIDKSEQLEKEGVKVHITRSGRYKAIGQASEPYSEDERDQTQKIVDNYYSLFVDHVAQNRDMTPEAIVAFEGDVFSAKEAESHNLIDSVKTLEDVMAEIGAEVDTQVKLEHLSQAYSAAIADNEAKQAEMAVLASKLEALQAENAQAVADALIAKVEASVKTLVEVEHKVAPAQAELLKERLMADFEGTMAAFALVPSGTAAPKSADVSLGGGDPKAEALDKAKADGLPVAESRAAAQVYTNMRVNFLDLSGDEPVVRKLR